MIVLALDVATRTGWAAGRICSTPVWGTQQFGRGKSNGDVLYAYRIWLLEKIDEVQPELICFESPFMPTVDSQFAQEGARNALTVRRLFGFAGITEATCVERHIRCYEARPSEIIHHFIGGRVPKKREEKKAAAVAMCKRLGFDVADDDEADAVALWCYAESIFEPKMISRRRGAVGLELALHGAL